MKYNVGDYIFAKDHNYDLSQYPARITRINGGGLSEIEYYVRVPKRDYFFLECEILGKANFVNTPLWRKLEGLDG